MAMAAAADSRQAGGARLVHLNALGMSGGASTTPLIPIIIL